MSIRRTLFTALTAAAVALALCGMGFAKAHQDHQDQGHHFTDHDRQVARDYYNAHRDHPPVGLRDQDRLPPDLVSRLVVGAVLGADFRAHEHPVPHALLVQLGPPPRGDRYLLVGHHIVLVDRAGRVIDVIHLES